VTTFLTHVVLKGLTVPVAPHADFPSLASVMLELITTHKGALFVDPCLLDDGLGCDDGGVTSSIKGDAGDTAGFSCEEEEGFRAAAFAFCFLFNFDQNQKVRMAAIAKPPMAPPAAASVLKSEGHISQN
jgi:hypothetical protein